MYVIHIRCRDASYVAAALVKKSCCSFVSFSVSHRRCRCRFMRMWRDCRVFLGKAAAAAVMLLHGARPGMKKSVFL